MRKITINLFTEDHDGHKVKAEGSMMMSEEEYQYFLDNPGEMIYHCRQAKDAVNRICKNAFDKVGIAISGVDDLKQIERRFYSEDGKLRSHTMVRFFRGNERRERQGHYFGNDDHDRAVQNDLRELLRKSTDRFAEELAFQDK